MAKTIISGAEYHNFEQNPIVTGQFMQPFLREKDDPTDDKKKKGDVIGFIFELENGESTIIGNSHQINKALTTEGVGVGSILRITFKGKGLTSDKQPINRFKVELLEPGDEGYFEPRD